jgi:pimeloyl-ACP methyl ester carboxylesterase
MLDTARATLCSRDPAREREIAQAVTDEMIDSLERLRVEEDIPHFTLAGHSLGGYLAGKYAVKYPNAVENLILISPVGIPHPPPAEQQLKPAEMDWRVRAIDQLWRWNVTPQGMLRVMGPRGPKMVTTVVNRRFGNRWAGEELDLIADYMYHISAAPGSGEYTLNALLEPVFLKSEEELAAIEDQSEDVVVNAAGELSAPAANRPTPAARKSRVINARSGVFARLPLEDELCKLKVPILLLYGDNDWLYYAGAENSVKKWKDSGVPAAALGIVSNAGHHLYLDNSKEFNRALISWATNTAKITTSSS